MTGLPNLLALLSAGLVLAAQATARAQVATALTTLVNFDGSNGSSPTSRLVLGNDGNFYGTTSNGGPDSLGTVFMLTPAGALTTLHAFSGGDGQAPLDGLVQGSDGNFYGTTSGLAALDEDDTPGTIFRITPEGAFTTLHVFNNSDGRFPDGALVQAKNGDFYGTTSDGGTKGGGTVYRITAAGKLKTLHNFTGGSDGSDPLCTLVQGSDGNFYGTTYGGDFGTVFRMTPGGALTTLHTFDGKDGMGPTGGLSQGADGNYYGTTLLGGVTYGSSTGYGYGYGTVFVITPAGALTTLHNFTGNDGQEPNGVLAQGSDGNFYGTTQSGGSTYEAGSDNGEGTVFQITPAGTFTTLYNFGTSDGLAAESGLVQTGSGSFLGTTLSGGANGDGTVFALTVATPPAFFKGEAALTNGVYYLAFPNGNFFGYYSFLSSPGYLYHFDLGYEYVIDAADGNSGVYFYDFASDDFFYTSPTFPFPYLYDFNLQSVVYYFPDTSSTGHYTTNPRSFYDFATGQVVTK